MEIFLWFVGNRGFQSGIAQGVGVHRTTVNKTISNMINRIVEQSHNWIRFPSTADEMKEANVLWQRHFRLPTVIGAVDCTHIEILKPGQALHGDEYICRKGYPSVNVQATCNALEQFTSISAEWPGSVHDARVWRRSPIRGIMTKYNGAVCLIGDSGYALSPWLITPFKPPQNLQER